MKHTCSLLLVLALLLVNAKAGSLEIGAPAPMLKVSQFIKGSPVSEFETGKVYVVEFWATWCGPCKQSIPHLTELAHQFSGKVTFIGVDVWEQDTNAVVKFVSSMAEKMDYTVATDTTNTYMANEWLKAAGQNGIPAAFVIDGSGKIAWIGHPMDGLDKTLSEVLAGTWDAAAAKKRVAAKKQAQALFNEGMEHHGTNLDSILEQAKKLESVDQEIGGLTPGKKFVAEEFVQQIRYSSALAAYQSAVMAEEAPAKLDELEAAARAQAPKDADFDSISKRIRLGLGATKAQKLFQQYLAAVGDTGDKEKAAGLAKQLGELKLKNPAMYNSFARTILTSEKVKARDLSLATQLAKSAVDLSEEHEAAFLDTYAKALFDSGKLSEAIEWQKKAVQTAKSDSAKNDSAATLKKYEAAQAAAK